ncbi:dihydroxyacetone kinase phosphoryl donor subunit DhaM [Fusobacterium sp.]|uniref:dihydroxyacetone kinase phosphoryl donor subunit DhaM n=1 Tax=Fusobacterium sp. TaxID=68766 RepID=UPI00290037B2|nr:dihydroxyacetone kinase phosphoryl donor subunit DhaM [Fusobacterium sp.]MDU1910134.1 dihydroxyacetone kinase phosphoryl donor subunit DhaM [Fusobacterium sp.]
MVGIVVVAHNPKLSQEIINFCMELKNSNFMLENGGGTEEDNRYGTCPEVIARAIKKANQGDGVVILCDLGSSVMNAETAKERLKDEIKVEIVDAPIVEGTIVGVSANHPKVNLKTLVEFIKESKEFPKF